MDGSESENEEVPKAESEYKKEDDEDLHKDKKTMNILFNGLNSNMFYNVINCITTKEVCDTIQTLCEGIELVRVFKMQLFVQQSINTFTPSLENP